MRRIRTRLRALFARRAADRDLLDEIAFHVELETEKNVALGMSPDEARRLAIAHFGGVQRVREEHLDVRRLQWIEDLGADLRFAMRMLRRAPVSSAAAIVTIALGIGANAAIFSAVNAVVLRPLPFARPEQLMMVTSESAERGWHRQYASTPDYLDWKDDTPAFASLAAYEYSPSLMTLTGRGDARFVRATNVTGNFFSTLGVRAERGRVFEDSETWDDQPATAVLSHGAWMREFSGDPSVIGQTVTLDGDSYRIVGIVPATFDFPFDNLDVWLPEHWSRSVRASEMWRRTRWMAVIGRLAAGATPALASNQLQNVADRLAREYPKTNAQIGASITGLQNFLIGDTRLPLLVLLASASFLLLIACANVGGLVLVQAVGRQREVALRLALGAGRSRLVRQAITESLLLSTFGGACGLLFGWCGTRALSALQPPGLLRVHSFGIDPKVTLYVVAITVASGLLFGIAPAMWTRRRDPGDVLKNGARGTQGGAIRRWSNAFVIGEVALALLMTTGAGLLVRSFWLITRVDPGYDARGVLMLSVNVAGLVTDRSAFYAQLIARAKSAPGVADVIAGSVPLSLENGFRSDFIARTRAPDAYGTELLHTYVSPNYFAALHIPLRRGRLFTVDDREGAPPVVVINETLARSYFAGEDPIGQSICFDKVAGPKCEWHTIVGVVGDVHDAALDKSPRITVFESTVQSSVRGWLLVRVRGDRTVVADGLRAIVRALDPRMVASIRDAEVFREKSLVRPRFFAALLLLFAVVGLVLSVVGVYALLAQVTRNRSREMGIRIALGAQSSQVRWLVVQHGLRLTAAGLGAGTLVALLSTRAMSKLLFGVAPNDPATFAAVALLLAATSLLAAWIPAVRASGANPVEALRAD